jgi:hypothetical protein
MRGHERSSAAVTGQLSLHAVQFPIDALSELQPIELYLCPPPVPAWALALCFFFERNGKSSACLSIKIGKEVFIYKQQVHALWEAKTSKEPPSSKQCSSPYMNGLILCSISSLILAAT